MAVYGTEENGFIVAIEKDDGVLFDPSGELGGAVASDYTVNVGFNRNRLVLR